MPDAAPRRLRASPRGKDAEPVEFPGLRRTNAAIYQLWDELADFPPGEIGRALTHCLARICDWIGAQNAFWLAVVRMAGEDMASVDPFRGWRIRCAEVLNPECTSPDRMRKGMDLLRKADSGEESRAMIAEAGQFRVRSLGTGLVDLESFRKTAHYDFFYRQRNINDRIWVVFPVNADTESYCFFDTYENGRRFKRNELYLAAEALRGLKWFHRQLMLSHGIGIGSAPLSPAERRLLPELLSGHTEKIIAQRLGLTRATVHQYVTALYRKYGVRGRTEFMALWLRGRT